MQAEGGYAAMVRGGGTHEGDDDAVVATVLIGDHIDRQPLFEGFRQGATRLVALDDGGGAGQAQAIEEIVDALVGVVKSKKDAAAELASGNLSQSLQTAEVPSSNDDRSFGGQKRLNAVDLRAR